MQSAFAAQLARDPPVRALVLGAAVLGRVSAHTGKQVFWDEMTVRRFTRHLFSAGLAR